MSESADETQCSILIVDDTPTNLRLLTGILAERGYTVRPALDGNLALSSALVMKPELILLDIVMPRMSGYEVCKRLKADERTCDIPVIFISALNEVFDKVKAFSLGGVDYITKPFQPEEVLARVETHLALRRLQKKLQYKNEELQRQIAERNKSEEALHLSEQQLRELNASKDTFFSIIAHDLKGPLGSLKDLSQFTEEHLDSYTPEKLKKMLVLQRMTAENLFKLLENLLTWSRIQRGLLEYAPQHLDLSWMITHNLNLFEAMAQQKQLTVTNAVPRETRVYADYNMVDTIIRNLLSNALKFTPAGGQITIAVEEADDPALQQIRVTDTGVGIEPEHLPKLFRIDVRYKRLGTEHEKGTGLGLILCKELVEQNGGTIWVESEVYKGTTFRFTLPRENYGTNS